MTLGDDGLSFEHVCLYVTGSTVLVFQERASDTFQPVRDRILSKAGRIHKKQSDYLVYALLDYVVDTYFVVLQQIDERIGVLNSWMSRRLAIY